MTLEELNLSETEWNAIVTERVRLATDEIIALPQELRPRAIAMFAANFGCKMLPEGPYAQTRHQFASAPGSRYKRTT